MLTKNVLVAALAATPLVAAHGKVAMVWGDKGGNATALGITGGDVPGPGPNKVTETDTTTFGAKQANADGLGRTTKGGKNTLNGITKVMAQSGPTLPQVSDGGMLMGVFHIVTTDGAGPIECLVDPTGTGKFSTAKEAKVLQQVPGNKGNIAPPGNKKAARWLMMRALMSVGIIEKRAANVNTDNPFKVQVAAGTKCTGSMGGQNDVCLMKITNNNNAGPFGGVVPFQIAGDGAAAPAPAGADPNVATTKNAKKATKRYEA